jgi:hypothetical protein
MPMSKEKKARYNHAIDVYKKHLENTIINNPPYRIEIVQTQPTNYEKDVMYVYRNHHGSYDYTINGGRGANFITTNNQNEYITEEEVKQKLPDILTVEVVTFIETKLNEKINKSSH